MENSGDVFSGLFALSFASLYSVFTIGMICFQILACILTIGGIILWVVMLVDIAQRQEKDFPEGSKDQKTMWLLIVILGGAIGALIYYFVVYKKAQELKLNKIGK